MAYKEKEIEKLYYSIGEVAEIFSVAPSLIRFWESEFELIKPKKNRKGNRQFTKEDIAQKKTNLLFFGNFYSMSLEDFNWGFNEMMKDRDYLYGSMIKDLYFLGKVLGRKYRLIRVSYTIFMWGLIIAVLAYAFELWYHIEYLKDVNIPIDTGLTQ